ncbi:hypothetical protein MOO45_00220 [Bombilactobacillus folatiphilus]|uniref:Uncharacterized protein n=1 Tax=Bombilactobacillus folatiphilus TaxID=2923362 RepID=A0ABY4P9F1_9LACO|nr:hypothetical protein [Bombilactobacillus folatiphilus]UQS82161.1 hypothetical protein MOO45_00220 [Bombilactobacillus folatiphilus]
MFFLVSIHNVQAKVSTKTAPPEITPNLIDDGFNSPEYTQEDQTVSRDDDYGCLIASLLLENNFTCDFYTQGETSAFYPYIAGHEKYLELHDTLNSFSFRDYYSVCPINDSGGVLRNDDVLYEPDVVYVSSTDHVNRGKFYLVTDQTGQVKALKWLIYSTKVDRVKDNVPNGAFLFEDLITPSKTATAGVNHQLFVKNVSQSTLSYIVADYSEIGSSRAGTYQSTSAIALGNNQGFTSLLGNGTTLATFRTGVADGPNRWLTIGLYSSPNNKWQGTDYSNYVGQEAGNYPEGTNLTLTSGQVLTGLESLWPVQKIAPQETQHHNIEFDLEHRGQAKPELTSSYSNTKSSRFNHPGDQLNLTVQLANKSDGQGSLTPKTFYVTLPQGLSMTAEDLKQITLSSTGSHAVLTGSYDATTRQVKMVVPTVYNSSIVLDNASDRDWVKFPVTIDSDAPIGNAVVKTSFSGDNKDGGGNHQTVTAAAPDLTIPITKAFDAKLTLGVKNTKDTSDYASSATYVPGDTLQYHMQYQLNEANMYNLTSPVTFSSRNAGLDFSNSAPSVTVNGDRSAASATVDPNTGKITVTKATGNFSPGDLIDLTYNAKAKADPVAGEPRAKHESTIKIPYNTVGINVTMNGQTLSNTSASTSLQRKDLDYFVRVPDVIDFGRNPRVFDSPFYNTTSGRLKFSHYSASSSKQYYLQVKYNQDLRTSAYAYLRPDSGNALIEYRTDSSGTYQSIDGTASNLTTSGLTTQGISDLTSYVSDKHFRLNSNDKPLGNYSGTMTWTYSNSI